VEIRPVWANKGDVIGRLLASRPQPDFLLAAGDDRTDEDMFERLQKDAYTLHVGPGPTRAAFSVPDFRSVRDLLDMLVKATSVTVSASSMG
jgi:trehalose 6-phosphate synthase/phosphatase